MLLNSDCCTRCLSDLDCLHKNYRFKLVDDINQDKISYNERKCQLRNWLEDEFHFLFECPYIWNEEKRGKVTLATSVIKVIEVLKSGNFNETKKYFNLHFKKRNSTHYYA